MSERRNPYRPQLHKGFWTPEEEQYANALIMEFKAGRLPLAEGTTLRGFLAKMLNCSPKRVSKKMKGTDYNGKQAYARSTATESPEEAEARRVRLQELELNFKRVSTAPGVASMTQDTTSNVAMSFPQQQLAGAATARSGDPTGAGALYGRTPSASLGSIAAMDEQSRQQRQLLQEVLADRANATFPGADQPADELAQLQSYLEMANRLQRNNEAPNNAGAGPPVLLGDLLRSGRLSRESNSSIESRLGGLDTSSILASMQRERELNLLRGTAIGFHSTRAAPPSYRSNIFGRGESGATFQTATPSLELIRSLTTARAAHPGLGSNSSAAQRSSSFLAHDPSLLRDNRDLLGNAFGLTSHNQGTTVQQRLSELQAFQRSPIVPSMMADRDAEMALRTRIIGGQISAQDPQTSNYNWILEELRRQNGTMGVQQEQAGLQEEKTATASAASLKRDRSSSGEPSSASDDENESKKKKARKTG